MNKISSLIRNYPFITPLIIFATLVLMGATAHSLWADEAETAFFAKTILQTGLPMGFDGVNVSAVDYATVLNGDLINYISPWLQFYLAALSFQFFSPSTFAARLPFILFGIGSVILIYYLVLKLSEDRKTALIATTLSSLSVPLILFSLQARYYSPVIFSGLLMILSTLYLSGEKKIQFKYYVMFLLAGVIYIYSHYLSFFIFASSLGLGWLFYLLIIREKFKKIAVFFTKFVSLLLVVILAFLPWYFILKPYTNPAGAKYIFSFDLIARLVPFYFYQMLAYLNLDGTLPSIFLILLAIILIVKIKKRQNINPLVFVVCLIASYCLVISLFTSIAQTKYLILVSIRYHLLLIPLALILAALIFFEIWRFNKTLMLFLLIPYLSSNIFTFNDWRSYFGEYILEVVNPYKTSDDLAAEYLETNAKEGETVFVNLNRSHEPLIFYLGNKVKFVNRISPFNRIIFPKNFSKLPNYIYNYTDDPDFVILYSNHFKDQTPNDFDIRLVDTISRKKPVDLKSDYSLTILPVYYLPDVSRPEIYQHKFAIPEPQYDEQVFIYRKKK